TRSLRQLPFTIQAPAAPAMITTATAAAPTTTARRDAGPPLPATAAAGAAAGVAAPARLRAPPCPADFSRLRAMVLVSGGSIGLTALDVILGLATASSLPQRGRVAPEAPGGGHERVVH